MDEREREVVREEPVVERNRTTVINTGERGSGGLIAAVLLLVVLAVIAFFVFGDGLGGSDKTDIKVDVEAPDVDLPDVDLPAPGNQTK